MPAVNYQHAPNLTDNQLSQLRQADQELKIVLRLLSGPAVSGNVHALEESVRKVRKHILNARRDNYTDGFGNDYAAD
jgi:hypothetical protein